MRNYTICILDKDIHYAKAFIKAVVVDHAGFNIGVRNVCSENCARNVDVCIGFGIKDAAWGSCDKAFEPRCGKYAGVSAILNEAKKFVIDMAMVCREGQARYSGKACQRGAAHFEAGTVICVYACAGGLGTSCAAIGIGRELARYRSEQVMYFSLEDAEDTGLFPSGLTAMCAEEALYRYLRLLNAGSENEGFEQLFRAAAAYDEYGLYRFAPDEGTGSLSGLMPEELYLFLKRITDALRLKRIVLDFGTRLHFLAAFAALLEIEEAYFIEIRPEEVERIRKGRSLFSEEKLMTAAFPFCDEDVRQRGVYTDVGIANAFGLAVKEMCDRIVGT